MDRRNPPVEGSMPVNTEKALKSLSGFQPGELVELLFVVSAVPSIDELGASDDPYDRMAAFNAYRANAMKPLIEAIRRRRALKILPDSGGAGHLLVRGKLRDFSDAKTGLLSEIGDLPVDVYPNDVAARAV